MHMPSTLAFCFYKDDLSASVPDWPDGAGFAFVCARDGRDGFVVFHEDEIDVVGRRIAAVLAVDAGEISAFPALPGCAPLKVQFGERVKLLDELTWRIRGELREAAENYLMAYRFARDEGLDLRRYMAERQVVVGDITRRPADAADTDATAAPEDAPVAAVAAPDDTESATTEPPAMPRVPSGYSRLSPRECATSATTTGTLRLLPGGQLAVSPIYATDTVIALPADRFFVRDDLRGMAIDMVDYGEGIEARFIIAVAQVPRPILRAVDQRGCAAHLSRVGRYLHVSLDPAGAASHRSDRNQEPEETAACQPETPAPAADTIVPMRTGRHPIGRYGWRAAAVALLFFGFGLFEDRSEARDVSIGQAAASQPYPAATRLADHLGRLPTHADPRAAFH